MKLCVLRNVAALACCFAMGSAMAQQPPANTAPKPVMLNSSKGDGKPGAVKMAFVDVQSAILQTEEGKSARAAIETAAKGKREELVAQQKELKKLEDEFLQQQSVLTDAQKQERQADFQKKFESFRMAQMGFEKEFRDKEMKETQKIFQNMAAIVEEISKKRGYDMVFERNSGGLLYATQIDDLTSDVVKEYNRRHPKKK